MQSLLIEYSYKKKQNLCAIFKGFYLQDIISRTYYVKHNIMQVLSNRDNFCMILEPRIYIYIFSPWPLNVTPDCVTFFFFIFLNIGHLEKWFSLLIKITWRIFRKSSPDPSPDVQSEATRGCNLFLVRVCIMQFSLRVPALLFPCLAFAELCVMSYYVSL